MGKSDIVSGQKFGKLTILEETEKWIYPNGKTRRQFKCKCDCGKEIIVKINDLVCGHTKSCGCLNQEKRSNRKFKDLTGQRFGRLIVLKRIGSKKHAKNASTPIYLCKCDCGNEATVTASELRSGDTKSCGCLGKEKIGKLNFKDLTNQTFGLLTVIKKVGVNKFGKTEWLCKCICGNHKITSCNNLMSGSTLSCGCINSIGEYKCKKILEENNIKYKDQFSFNELKSNKGYLLRFDFAIFENNDLKVLIEYQGIQHIKDIEFGKEQRETTDLIKKEYCLSHNIPLEEIWFNENINERMNQIISTYLHVNSVPSSQETA